jgi:tagaturonate reductase
MNETASDTANSGPETILQLGAGRFLRGFFDRFVQEANDAGRDVGRVVVVQSTAGRRAELLSKSGGSYHVLVRGIESGEIVDRVEKVSCISRALSAVAEWDSVLALARSPHLKLVVSNTTEAGYVLVDGDAFDASPPAGAPAKLARLLFERFRAGLPPLTLLPCELIERNADRLRDLVAEQARRWRLADDFLGWLTAECTWLNSLVDCIITDGPPDHPLAAEDPLLISAEPYRLWAIEKPPGRDFPVFDHPDIRPVADLAPFYLRKVRILNGAHTALTAKFLPEGFRTVREVADDRRAGRWVRDLMFEEIVPTLVCQVDGAAEFADDTFDRYRNPYLDHLLSNITMNHAEKERVRLWPTRDAYRGLYGKDPVRLSGVLGWIPPA